MAQLRRSWLGWLRAGVAACGLMMLNLAAAQAVVGRVYEGSLPTDQGYDVPLPEARWRVTYVVDRKFQVPTANWGVWQNNIADRGNATRQSHSASTGVEVYILRVVALRNEASQAQLPYLFVTYSLRGSQWNSPCNQSPSQAFDVSDHWTQPNQLVNKCTRKFVSSLPDAASKGSWEGLAQGIDAADSALQKTPMLLNEISLTQHRGAWISVEAFMRTEAAGASPAELQDAATSGGRHPWNFATQIWGGRYLIALENAVLKKQPTPMEAFEIPTQDSVEDRIRQASLGGPRDAQRAEVPDAAPAPVDDRELVERIRRMADSRPLSAPVTADAVALPAIVATAAAAAVPPPSRPEPSAVKPIAAAPSVSAEEFARLATELARLRDELKSRPLPEAPAPVKVLTAAALPAATGARRLAMVIGNDAYQSVARLQNARTDARAMAEVLGRVGYQVRLRTDLSERAMKDELRAFKSEIQGGDEVLFYFAGHGVQLSGANYLLPTDIRGEAEDQVRDDALLLQKVLDDIQERKARFALAIVDACRDNPFRTAGRALGGRGLAPTAAATGQMVMFSAGAGQQALDRLGERDQDPNGLFTRILLKEMDRPELSVDRVLRAVRNQVVELARSVGHEQVPALYDQSIGEFYFRR